MKPLSPYSHAHDISEDKERQERFKKQFKERGFDDTELWSLDITIAKFIYPRLVRFKELADSFPSSINYDEWLKTLDKMIQAFDLIGNKENVGLGTEEEEKIIEVGLSLFNKHFRSLWN